MSKKIRLIARLDVKDENLVKGIQLEGLRKLGDPNAFARKYYEQGIDELLYIDIVASLYNRNNLSDIVRRTVDDVYIPVCVGGGLRSVEDVRAILSICLLYTSQSPGPQLCGGPQRRRHLRLHRPGQRQRAGRHLHCSQDGGRPGGQHGGQGPCCHEVRFRRKPQAGLQG